MKTNKRNSNIELLRLFAGLSVIVLHFNFRGDTGAILYTSGFTQLFLYYLESVCICAVNIFIMITGYFSCSKNSVKSGKLVRLLIQTMVFGLFFGILSCFHNRMVDSGLLLKSFAPTNYFVILYISLMLLSPFINLLINSLTLHKFKVLLIISLALFSIIATAVDVLNGISGNAFEGMNPVSLKGSGGGYTITNFICVYMLGAYIRKREFKEIKTSYLVSSLITVSILITAWQYLLPYSARDYCNPLIILESSLLLIVFLRIVLNSDFVNKIAPAAFTSFLIHEPLLGLINFNQLSNLNTLSVIAFLIVIVICIYSVSVIVMLIWNYFCEKIINGILSKMPTLTI